MNGLLTRATGAALTAALLAVGGCRPAQQEQVDTTVPAGELGPEETRRRHEALAPARNLGARSTAQFIDTQGRPAGEVEMQEGPTGVLLRGQVTGLTPGEHAIHFHETGRCEPPFETAGEHFALAGEQHGLLNEDGPHAGDLPNLVADADGRAEFEFHTGQVTIGQGQAGLLEGEGVALVVHASGDDHQTDPAGESGDRIACAVIRS